MREVTTQVDQRLALHAQRPGPAQQVGQDLPCRLDAALGPPALLNLQSADRSRDLSGNADVVQKHEAPAAHLGSVAEIQIFGERVGHPSARVYETGLPPHPARSVEVEKASGLVPSSLLEVEVAVQEGRLRARQSVLVFVQMVPTRLDHAYAGIREGRQERPDDAPGGYEVRVEHQEEVAPRTSGPRCQRTCLEAASHPSPHVGDRDST